MDFSELQELKKNKNYKSILVDLHEDFDEIDFNVSEGMREFLHYHPEYEYLNKSLVPGYSYMELIFKRKTEPLRVLPLRKKLN